MTNQPPILATLLAAGAIAAADGHAGLRIH